MGDMSEPQKSGFSLGRMVPILIIGAAFVFGAVFLREFISFETLAANHEAMVAWRDANFALAVVAYMVIYIAAVAFSVPGSLFLTLAGGLLFGLFPGLLIIVAAATIGAVCIFLAARFGLGDTLQKRLDTSDGTMRRIRDGIRENEVSYLFIMRLVPAIPFFVANLAPALVGVSLRNFAFTTFFGIIPGTAVYTWVGAGLGEVIASGETPSLGIIWEWHILGPLLGLAALASLPIVLKALRKGA